MVKSTERQKESRNWYKDKYQYVLVQRNILALTALVALGCSVVAVFAVMQLTPHKSVEPFVIQIDEKSGIVQRVDPVARTEFTSSEAIDRYFVAQYVRARETYIRSVRSQNYDTVRVMSDPGVFANYRRDISASNPESPAFVLRDSGQRTVKFKSISFIKSSSTDPNKEKVVQARILLTDTSAKLPAPIEYHNIVTMTFRYSNLALNEEERFMNPIGFVVTEYASEKEVVR